MHDTKNTMFLLEPACEILMLITNASSHSLKYMHNFLVRLAPYFSYSVIFVPTMCIQSMLCSIIRTRCLYM